MLVRLSCFFVGTFVAAALLSGCGDDGNKPGCKAGADCDMGPTNDSGDTPDLSGTDMPPIAIKTCKQLPALAEGTCSVTAGDNSILISGNILTPTQILEGGQVLVDASGKIACVDCDCSAQAASATQLGKPQP